MQKPITNTIAQFRERSGLTQKELARQVGVTRQTIIALEQGHCIPSLLLAFRIAHYFGVSIEDIFTYRHGK